MQKDLHDRDCHGEQHPDVDILDFRCSGQVVSNACQHGGQHQHGLQYEVNAYWSVVVETLTVRLIVIMWPNHCRLLKNVVRYETNIINVVGT